MYGCSLRLILLLFQPAVGEPYMVELQPSISNGLCRMSGRDNLRWSIKQFEDTFRRGHGSLENVVFVAQVHDRAEKALRILHECDHDTNRHRPPNDPQSAKPKDRRYSDGGENFHHRYSVGLLVWRIAGRLGDGDDWYHGRIHAVCATLFPPDHGPERQIQHSPGSHGLCGTYLQTA